MKTKKKPIPTQKNDESTIGHIHAFIAEDSPLMMALLTRTLSKDKRIKIVGSATDGWEALCYASSLDPDLVLVDLHMPGLDGAEVARRLKQRPNPPTIFVVTSDDSAKSRARSLTAGADAFLVKRSDLSSQIQTAIQNFFPTSGAA
jgi:DNA-binding NarL/FixJ family response regulator